MQIKLLTGTQDLRVALPERFGLAAKQATQASHSFLQERKWVEQGVRYGDVKEIGEEMVQLIEALKDLSKLVRWRAARFLYEVGDASALPALREALGDPEFEVALQVKMAVARIEGGQTAKGPVW